MKNQYCDRTAAVQLRSVPVALIVAIWAAVGLGQGAARSAESSSPGQPDRWQKYDIILKRNIFSRQRAPARQREERRDPENVVLPNPETYFLLKGIVQENDAFIAFVENTQGGGVLRLRAGDRIARGSIKALSLDAIEYQLENQTVAVKLGCDLEGRYGTVATSELPDLSELIAPTAPPQQGTAGTSGRVSSPPPAQTPLPSGDEAEILKRLMEQRRQQLGQ